MAAGIKRPKDNHDDDIKAFGIDPDNMDGVNPAINDIDLSPWLEESQWEQPKWFTKGRPDGKKIDKNYDSYILDTLRWRYTRLEGDFRTVFNNYYGSVYIDKVSAQRIISFLNSAKTALEKDNCDPSDVTNLLDMTEQYMVWLYPPHVANAQAAALASQLKASGSHWGDYLEVERNRSGQTLGGLRAALDKVKQAVNEDNQLIQLNSGLQLERLEMLKRWGVIVLIIMLAGLPFIIKSDAAIFKDSILADPSVEKFRQWLGLTTIGIIGGVGAFLSGLLQMRRTKVTVGEFKENIMQFELRPIVGAIFAMMIASLLTWDIISGIEIKNAGAYVLLAFLSGFSERYFLSLLRIDDEGNSTVPQGSPIIAANSSNQPAAAVNTETPPTDTNVNDVQINQ